MSKSATLASLQASEPNKANNTEAKFDTRHKQKKTENLHLIFSTSCSAKDWQSYLFFYLAWATKQEGEVTHIVSGCDPEQEEELKRLHREHHTEAMSSNFKVHFTPDYSIKKQFQTTKYWNKPFGVKHWLENRFGYSWDAETNEVAQSTEYDDDIVILIDPDMLMLRNFKNDFSSRPKTMWTQYFQQLPPDELYYKVTPGHVIASEYAFGANWLFGLKRAETNLTYVLGTDDSNVYKLTQAHASKLYAGGPPYMATARDFYRIAHYWVDFLPRYFEQKPGMMNEMYSYSMAVAHLQLKHQLARGFMISDINLQGQEGWNFLQEPWNGSDDKLINHACDLNAYTQLESLPQVLHFCQRYGIGEFFISKYKVPKRSFTCDFPLFEEPPKDVAKNMHVHMGDFSKKTFQNTKGDTVKRANNAYMVCSLYQALNEASTFYKDHHCHGKANYDKSWQYFKVYDKDPHGRGGNGKSKSKP